MHVVKFVVYNPPSCDMHMEKFVLHFPRISVQCQDVVETRAIPAIESRMECICANQSRETTMAMAV